MIEDLNYPLFKLSSENMGILMGMSSTLSSIYYDILNWLLTNTSLFP